VDCPRPNDTGFYRPRKRGRASPERSCEARTAKSRRDGETPLYRLVEEHYEEFERVYPDRFQHKYGFWRLVITKAVHDYLSRPQGDGLPARQQRSVAQCQLRRPARRLCPRPLSRMWAQHVCRLLLQAAVHLPVRCSSSSATKAESRRTSSTRRGPGDTQASRSTRVSHMPRATRPDSNSNKLRGQRAKTANTATAPQEIAIDDEDTPYRSRPKGDSPPEAAGVSECERQPVPYALGGAHHARV